MRTKKRTTMQFLKNKFSNMFSMKSRKGKSRKGKSRKFRSRKGKKQRGGTYSQFGSNIANTHTYSTGGNLSPADSALANPVPFKILPSTVNSIDNYNHYTKSGIQL